MYYGNDEKDVGIWEDREGPEDHNWKQLGMPSVILKAQDMVRERLDAYCEKMKIAKSEALRQAIQMLTEEGKGTV